MFVILLLRLPFKLNLMLLFMLLLTPLSMELLRLMGDGASIFIGFRLFPGLEIWFNYFECEEVKISAWNVS